MIEPLSDRIMWRAAVDNVVDLITDEVIVKANELITPEIAKKIEEAGYERIRVRSVLTCEAKTGAARNATERTLRPASLWNSARQWASLRRSRSANRAPS